MSELKRYLQIALLVLLITMFVIYLFVGYMICSVANYFLRKEPTFKTFSRYCPGCGHRLKRYELHAQACQSCNAW